MESNTFPIDIHLTKLLDWILDRRHCQRDWPKNVLPIRAKINQAIVDMPENEEIKSLLSGSTIHYFNCLKIVEILKETEKNSKNIFGMYSSQRMKDWNNVISLYQKNNIYLAEAASILQRSVQFEITALKKQINKCQQQQTECEEKRISYGKSVNEINIQIKNFCAELGIEGENISKELKALPNQLGDIYDSICKKCFKLENAIEFYSSYVEYFFQRSPSDSLSILDFLVKNGNTFVYQWRTGVEPKQVEKPKEIRFDFGDEQAMKTVNENEIDFNIEDLSTISNSALNQDEAIDWGDFGTSDDIPVEICETNDLDLEALRNEIVVEGSGVYIPLDNIAKGNDALNILEFPETRNLLLNDLFKLDAFLKQKYNEMKSESDNILISTILQDTPKSIREVTERDLKTYIGFVQEIFNYLKLKKVEQLLHINDSPKYLKRLYEKFESKKNSIEKYNRYQLKQETKMSELVAEETVLKSNLKLIIQKTKELQKHVCDDLSKKYNGVRINLMGEINLL